MLKLTESFIKTIRDVVSRFVKEAFGLQSGSSNNYELIPLSSNPPLVPLETFDNLPQRLPRYDSQPHHYNVFDERQTIPSSSNFSSGNQLPEVEASNPSFQPLSTNQSGDDTFARPSSMVQRPDNNDHDSLSEFTSRIQETSAPDSSSLNTEHDLATS